MTTTTVTPSVSREFLLEVQQQSQQNILRCYQCGKCSAGCPLAYAMDLSPRRVMRAVQLGLADYVLGCTSIWICVSCETCSVRCPREIDIARVMESLRMISIDKGFSPAEKEVETFHRVFLDVIEKRGRAFETELVASYSMGGLGTLKTSIANISLLPGMISKGKMALAPPNASGVDEVKKIFAKVREIEQRKTSGGSE
ncbi:MAG: 4Fe-4S dicluster domain-containing protein [Chloroflexota bacterium]|nr:4Fe-4S dicluster domain-containing protein [Chloroflexota bacterium]